MPLIAQTLSTLGRYNLWNSATKEFWGANVPHVALVQSKNEAIDQAVNQFGNLGWIFGVSAAYSKLIDVGLRKALASRQLKSMPNAITKGLRFKQPAAQAWYLMGKSLALYAFAGTYVLHSGFLRNWLTYKRTGAASYAEVVGLNTHHTAQQAAQAKQKASEDIHRFNRGMLTGIISSVGILATTTALIARRASFPKILQGFNKHCALPGGDYRKVKDLPLYFYWAVPAYGSLFMAIRDPLEKKELLWRAGGFGLAFMVLPRTVERWVNKAVKGKSFKHFGPGKNVAFLAQLMSGLVFYASIPTVLNLIFRKKRAEKLGLLPQPAQEAMPKMITQPNPFTPGNDMLQRPVQRLNYPLIPLNAFQASYYKPDRPPYTLPTVYLPNAFPLVERRY
ncbi:MAG: hypothetical protein VKJ06_04225 [Vampirovibrionales bacterium]|nr:hypothetical protein [Vampirovibrionales bacterium]